MKRALQAAMIFLCAGLLTSCAGSPTFLTSASSVPADEANLYNTRPLRAHLQSARSLQARHAFGLHDQVNRLGLERRARFFKSIASSASFNQISFS